jgi:hypothetical protein
MSTNALEKIDRALQALPERPGQMVDVIVSIARADPPADLPAATPTTAPADRSAHVAQAQARFDAAAAPLLARLNALGAERVRPLWIAHAVAAQLPRAALAALAAENTVSRIALDTKRKLI